MISHKCKYAFRAVLFLAVKSNEHKKIRIDRISKELKIPLPYLRKIMQALVPKGIISSVKGPNGGFYISDKSRRVPILNLIEAVDGLGYFEQCGLGLTACSDSHPCPIHDDFKVARDHLYGIYRKKTIEQLASETVENNLILVR